MKASNANELIRNKESTFTRVESINTFIREDYDQDNFQLVSSELKNLIESWVRTTSFVMTEFSLYVNFHFQTLVRGNNAVAIKDYFDALHDNSFLKYLYAVQGKGGTSKIPARDGNYMHLRVTVNDLPARYDCEYMSPIFQQAVNTFVVNLKNSIVINMPRRIAKFFRCFLDDEGRKYTKRQIKEQVEALFYPQFRVDRRLGISFNRLKHHPFEYIPFLFWLSEQLIIEDVSTFHVIPKPSYKMRHIHIPTSAIAQVHLAYCKRTRQRAVPEKTIRANYRMYWLKYFKIEQFEREGFVNGDFFVDSFQGLLTDNVKACVLMTKTIWLVNREIDPVSDGEKAPAQIPVERGRILPPHHRVSLYNSRKKPFPEYHQVIGADPGRKLTIGGVKIDIRTGVETNFKLSSKFVNDAIGYYSYKSKIEYKTKAVMQPIQIEREALGNIGAKSLDYITYTRFELKHMTSRFMMQYDRDFREWRFTAYCRKKSFYASYVAELCPPDKSHLVFYGGVKFASFIRGYIFTSQKALVEAFEELPNCDILPVNEYRTTKCCSKCFNVMIDPHSPHRYRYCEHCNTTWDRDVNGGRNIAIRGLAQHFGHLGYTVPIGLRSNREVQQQQIIDNEEVLQLEAAFLDIDSDSDLEEDETDLDSEFDDAELELLLQEEN